MAAAVQRNVGSLLRRLRRLRFAVIIGLGVLLFAITNWTSLLYKTRFVRDLAGIAHDTHFRLKGSGSAHRQVAIVGITSSCLDQQDLAPLVAQSEAVKLMHDNVWPWPRSVHARVIERLFEQGAKIVAVDIAMPSERPGDDELIAVLKKYAGRVVLASISQQQAGTASIKFFHPNSRFEEAAGNTSRGLVLYKSDEDAVIRRYDSRTSELREAGLDDGNHDLFHFAARSAELFTGREIAPRYSDVLSYTGKPATYDYISVEQIFVESLFRGTNPRFQGGSVFRDKLVFYGPIAEILHDVHATPFGMMPGVEIHAQLAGALIAGQRIMDASPFAASLFELFVVVACALVVLWIKNPTLQVVTLAATLIAAFFISHLAFLNDVLFPTVPWLLTGAFTGFAGVVYLFAIERMERAQVRKVFGRFVSKRIAEVVLRNAEEFEHARAGERREVAVLFSDIRSFTTWSENAAPENLVGQLNEYFESMVPLIEDTEGNAQKFIGDAILAAWGDTHSSGHEEDCRRAVSAAMKMRVALQELNARWQGRDDRISISIGIGINHGSVVTGEVGHSERREFTVLGDGVNFAARMESATKQFHTDCLVGESVEQLTRAHFIFRDVGFLRVKGKTKPVHIFSPLSEKTTPAPEWLADYNQALALHRARNFSGAAALFADVNVRCGGDDFLCGWYLALGRKYLIEPPREDWDGSETLTEK